MTANSIHLDTLLTMGMLWFFLFAATFVALILGAILVSFIAWRIARGMLHRRGIKAGAKKFDNTFLAINIFGFLIFGASLFIVVLGFPDKAEMAASIKTTNGFSASRITVELNTDDKQARDYFVDTFTPLMKMQQRRIAYHEHTLRGHTSYTLRSQISSRYRIDGRKLVFITARPLSQKHTQKLTTWARSIMASNSSLARHIERISIEQIHFMPRMASGNWIEVP